MHMIGPPCARRRKWALRAFSHFLFADLPAADFVQRCFGIRHTKVDFDRTDVNDTLRWDRQSHHECVAKSSSIPPTDYGFVCSVCHYDGVILHSKVTDRDALLLIFAGPGAIEVSENCTAEQTFSYRTSQLWFAHLKERV